MNERIRSRRHSVFASLVATGVLLVGLWALAAPSAFAQGQGNEGFIKINGEELDDIPNNDPHVGCDFLVEFYNYEGAQDVQLAFIGIPPTGGGVLLTDAFTLENDPAGGGDDLDAAREYTLDFTGIEPHPQQGFHVRLEIHATGSQGADVKHKVFWVEGCVEEPPPTTTTPPPDGTTPPPGVETPPVGGVVTGAGGTRAVSPIPTLLLLAALVGLTLVWRLRSRSVRP